MKNIFFSLSLFLLSYSFAAAQVPGYQGKRFFIEIGGTFFPNYISANPTAQNKGISSFPFGKNTGHFTMVDRYNIGINYVVGRKHTFQAIYNYSVSGLYLGQHSGSPIIGNSYSGSVRTPSKTTSGSDVHQLFYQLHIHEANLNMSFSGKNNINLAPLGFYHNLGLRFLFIKGNLRDQRVEYASNQYPDHIPRADQLAPLNIKAFTFMLGITYHWGYRAIFGDRIILDVGLQATLFPQHPLSAIGFVNGGSENNQFYQNKVINAVSGRYLLGIHIGVGVLLF